MSRDLFGLSDHDKDAIFGSVDFGRDNNLPQSSESRSHIKEAGTVSASAVLSRPLSIDALKALSRFDSSSSRRGQRKVLSDEPIFNPKFTKFSEMPSYKKLSIERKVAKEARIFNPFFLCHDSAVGARTFIEGKEYLNFSSYDYLGLGSAPEVRQAAAEALIRWGTSAGASRLVAGEKSIHRELELALARHYQAEAAMVYVSGHATNVSTISQLFGARDIIFHDSLAHNSIVLGAKYSGARRISFPHNDMNALQDLLQQYRYCAERCLIVTEGVFSMDGNIADLPRLVELKKKYGAFLMVDEAHALGVLGAHGSGTAEYFHLDPREIDIWMGTLSKTLCSCGGYIAGNKELIDILKFNSPSFVYSVGISPVLAGASLAALNLLEKSAERTLKLQHLSDVMLTEAARLGLNTGRSAHTAIVPVIIGNSILAGMLAQRLFNRGLNVLPIIYPVVEEGAARLRFFLSASHNESDVRFAIRTVAEELNPAQKELADFNGKSETSPSGCKNE